jgi:hypothetical protein
MNGFGFGLAATKNSIGNFPRKGPNEKFKKLFALTSDLAIKFRLDPISLFRIHPQFSYTQRLLVILNAVRESP